MVCQCRPQGITSYPAVQAGVDLHNGRPAKHKTDTVELFYYYPSGGTIRDKHMNIIFYEPRLDAYKEFKYDR